MDAGVSVTLLNRFAKELGLKVLLVALKGYGADIKQKKAGNCPWRWK